MSQSNDLPQDVDMEKELLAALLVRQGEIVPAVNVIVCAEDFYRPEHQIIFRVITRLYAKGTPPNVLSIFEEMRKTGELDKVDRKYLLSIAAMSLTNAYAVTHAKILKEKANLRRLMCCAESTFQDAHLGIQSSVEIISRARDSFDKIIHAGESSVKTDFADFFADHFNSDVEEVKAYAVRKVGFDNLDEYQFFTPGLYVIGATPAAGKTTFCWQLLEQLAQKGESCIFCSYEMSRLELFSKSLARELFRRDAGTALTASQIRRGASNLGLREAIVDFAFSSLKLSVLELKDETVDELLNLLRPFCVDKTKAPVVCLDYLQIMPTGRESTKLGIDETVRKLKKFQRDTNTTFIVISSFNRMNYAQTVSFESFKESGNIEYTADVVWALQLNIMNHIKSGDPITDSRRKIDAAKKEQPRQIQLKCLKNRQGTNYDCFFEYYSAHDCFKPCENFDEEDLSSTPERNEDRR